MIGKTFGRYRIVEKLGQGGMGEVWLAHDSSLDRKVALKFLPHFLEQDPVARKRFLREARSAAALDHPYICSIHEIGEFEGKAFIAMEYVQGETLKDRITREKLTLPRALEIASEISQALARAHNEGIVHRDLKPSNIMLTSDGHVKVMDFGLAKRVSGADSEVGETRTGLTEYGSMVGTVSYMSPEQIRGGEVDARSDVFSFGLVLYELLAGAHPFPRRTDLETASAILNEAPDPPVRDVPDLPASVQRLLEKMLAKEPRDRYASIADVRGDLERCRGDWTAQPATPHRRRSLGAAAAVLVLLVVAASGYFYVSYTARVRWATETALPEIARLAGEENFSAAFALAQRAAEIVSDDPRLSTLWQEVSAEISIQTDPPGAEVYMKDYEDAAGPWEHLGTSPIERLRISRGFKRWRIEKNGFLPSESAGNPGNLKVVLDQRGTIPEEMVRVTGGGLRAWITGIDPIEQIQLGDYLLDRHEVSNQAFKKFIDAGGYENADYWKHPFIKNGRVLSFNEAMAEFRDATGRPGPSTWTLSTYPEGQGDLPVSGVNWYEAAAYCEFAGKNLPTVYHWIRAAGTETGRFLFPVSRFGGEGPIPVGTSAALSPFGAYDMAGNVREWCWNSYGDQKYILGGAWSDPSYMFNFAQVLPAFDRSASNGFRCLRYLDDKDKTEIALGEVELTIRDYSREKPVSDSIFQVYKQQFAYDRTDLKAVVESRDTGNEHWVQEKVTFESAYGSERVIGYLVLPKHVNPPYQTVIAFPGSGAITQKSLANAPAGMDYIVKSGRALMMPVYKGTYERNGGLTSTWPNTSHRYKEYVVYWVKDLKRSIDTTVRLSNFLLSVRL